jgi:1,4-alpha-glucan branching enzyme
MRTKIHSSATAGEPQLSVPGCYDSYEFMGAHPSQQFGEQGWMFRVWAPNARAVAVVGDFNGWDQQKHPMIRSHGGIWYLFIPGLQQYDNYQYAVCTPPESGSSRPTPTPSTPPPGRKPPPSCTTWRAISGGTATGPITAAGRWAGTAL